MTYFINLFNTTEKEKSQRVREARVTHLYFLVFAFLPVLRLRFYAVLEKFYLLFLTNPKMKHPQFRMT